MRVCENERVAHRGVREKIEKQERRERTQQAPQSNEKKNV
jgi:hypothetical protein